MAGYSNENEADIRPEGYQALHLAADGNGWKGSIHENAEDARSEAEEYARNHKVQPGEVAVMYIYPGMNTSGKLPPNPLAERKLKKPITLQALVGRWTMIYTTRGKNFRYNLEVFPDGTCNTDYGARFVKTKPAEPDMIQVFHDSAFAVVLQQGEGYILSVHRFDGENMSAFVDGIEEQPMQLVREEN